MILTDLSDDEIDEYRKKISYLAYDIEEENDFDIMISPHLKEMMYWKKQLDLLWILMYKFLGGIYEVR